MPPSDPASGPDVVSIDAGASPAPVRLCVIDLGTNSFHAIVVDAHANGTFVILDKIKEMVKLGEGGLSRHELTEAAMQRGVEALRRIWLLAEGWGVEEYLAFATSAIREAYNGGDFIEQVRREVDLNIRTISGEMEARLIYEGVRRAVDMPEPALLVDIGGGSTELIVGTSAESFFQISLKLGAARMTEQFVGSDPLSDDERAALEAHYRKVLRPMLAVAREYGVRDVVGSSGTMENLAQVTADAAGDGRSIYRQAFEAGAVRDVAQTLLASDRKARTGIGGIDEKRLDQIVAGVLLVDVLLADLGIEHVRVSSNALREGMVVDFIERNYRRLARLAPYAGVRRRSVVELGYKCQWEEEHARHVARLALRLFDVCKPLHGLGDSARELLEYAALLHDVGYHISRSSHHKHSRYIIQNADLRGFQPEEVDVMAFVARYHRKALPKKKHTEFQDLPKRTRETVLKLAAFVRLAEGLDRSHFQNVERLDVDLDDKALTLTLHTHTDPQLDVWGTRRDADLFEHVYDRRVQVQAVEDAGVAA